ncbi:hypothetical protein HYZ64_01290 [Candidatus Berkelbacteria bacterium]|nr:hypothetical protein [Candidatus Berkelbacteria bacterium]
MALTKSDLKQVKEIVAEIVETEVGALADAVQHGFKEVHEKFDGKFDQLSGGFDGLNQKLDTFREENAAAHARFDARLDLLERDVSAIRKELVTIRRMLDTVVTQSQLNVVLRRVERMERQLGLVKER